MVSNRDQHFVPQFYLRRFASASTPRQRSISLHMVDLNRTVHGASIRDQCSRPWLYGRDGIVERELANFEGAAATAIEAIEGRRAAPERGSQNDYLMRLFLGLQSHRTSRRLAELRASDRKFIEVVFKGDVAAAEQSLGGKLDQMGIVDLVQLTPLVVTGMLDLECIVVAADAGGTFVTSDNPVVLYNQYCERVAEMWGTTGATTRGLQAFLPLSPRACLILFDSEVYFVPTRSRTQTLRASAKDVDAMNALQVLCAETCIYFPDSACDQRVERALSAGRGLRPGFGTRLTESVDEEDSNRSLVGQFIAIPSLHLNLSFLKLLPAARAIEPMDRMNRRRTEADALVRALRARELGDLSDLESKRPSRSRTYRHIRTA